MAEEQQDAYAPYLDGSLAAIKHQAHAQIQIEHHIKRSRQADHWKKTILPLLLPAYLEYRANTKSGRNTSLPHWKPTPCMCISKRQVEVKCLQWDRTSGPFGCFIYL